jgi:hypothetical protein
MSNVSIKLPQIAKPYKTETLMISGDTRSNQDYKNLFYKLVTLMERMKSVWTF